MTTAEAGRLCRSAATKAGEDVKMTVTRTTLALLHLSRDGIVEAPRLFIGIEQKTLESGPKATERFRGSTVLTLSHTYVHICMSLFLGLDSS